MKYNTLTNLITEADNCAEFDSYVSERGWQEWMSEYEGEKIASILTEIWEFAKSENKIKHLVKRQGISQAKFACEFKIPKRSIENWCSKDREAPDYVISMIAFITFKEIKII